MKTVLIIILIIVAAVCWVFGTSTTVNGEHSSMAFKVKSIFYWTAVILSFFIGMYVGN